MVESPPRIENGSKILGIRRLPLELEFRRSVEENIGRLFPEDGSGSCMETVRRFLIFHRIINSNYRRSQKSPQI